MTSPCTGPNCQGHPHSPECRAEYARSLQSTRSEAMENKALSIRAMFDVLIPAFKGIPTRNQRLIALDNAVMARFPDVACETRDMVGLDMRTTTEWWRKGTDHQPLEDLEAWKVRLFVKRWLATHHISGGDDGRG